jgi:hypothetical protein
MWRPQVINRTPFPFHVKKRFPFVLVSAHPFAPLIALVIARAFFALQAKGKADQFIILL